MVQTIETTNAINATTKFFSEETWKDTIVVHSGVFHAHDVAASLPFSWVIRTRNKEVIDYCSRNGATVVDVGMGKLDHHAWKGFKGLPTMFSMRQLNGCNKDDFIILESIAKIDCGEEAIDYVSSLISSFNPCWNESSTPEDYDKAFKEARSWLNDQKACWLIALKQRELAREAGKLEAASIVDKAMFDSANSALLVLPRFVPWQEKVCHYNELASGSGKFSFLWVLFPAPDGSYRVQAVPKEAGSMEFHVPVGASPTDEGLVFIHPNKFICGYTSKEAAIKAVRGW